MIEASTYEEKIMEIRKVANIDKLDEVTMEQVLWLKDLDWISLVLEQYMIIQELKGENE